MTMHPFGLDDTRNVSVAALHYAAPALILLYFIFASSTTHSVTTVAQSPNSASASESHPLVRPPQYQHSSLLKWVFVLAVLTFVRKLDSIILIFV